MNEKKAAPSLSQIYISFAVQSEIPAVRYSHNRGNGASDADRNM